ncbi:lysosomal acid phosphatase-like isoform X1 [Homalodisca vitripennis]|uniref:lysosomal acid phosphatase-like isoform X1 n=1 Tax=Homalodisca vitripennis TaxID=197043 RepID=UPI001EE9EA99|nr:lysosomal acid phosphatase-like isoform X1 [Homalodisca vitripennis]
MMPSYGNFRMWANSQSGLLLLCALTVAVLAVVYNFTDESLPADQPSVATHSELIAANLTGSRVVPTLRFVTAVSRHGNRGPSFTYPKSPYQHNDTKIWPYGVGELTQKGRMQMFNLGKKFRSLYNGFLGQIYRPGEFKGLSTPMGRTLQSAELFLAGLFPPTGFQMWNKDLQWQPIPVFPNFLDRNLMVPPTGPNLCPKFREVQKSSLKNYLEEYKSELDKLVEYALPYTGYNTDNQKSEKIKEIANISILFLLWESFTYPQGEGLPLPDWSKKIFPEPLTFLIAKVFQAATMGSDTQIRYLEGEMFKEMVEHMRSKEKNTLKTAKQMLYYSGHDNTILGLQAILGLDREVLGHVLPGSALVFELHQNQDGRFYVQVLQIDGSSPDSEPKKVNIPRCESPCDFQLFLNITEKYYNITDYKKECQLDLIA